MIQRLFLASVLIITISICYSHANAGDKEITGTITLEQAISSAVSNNPGLGVLSYELAKAKGRTLQAGLLPNPEISLGVAAFNGSGEKSLLLSQEIQLGDKRLKRKNVAALSEELILWDIKALRLDIIRQTTQSFYDVLGLKELLKLNVELTRLAEEVYQTVKERVSAGKVSPLEGIKARANLDNQRIELKNIEKELKSAIKGLNAVLGSKDQSFETVEGNLELLEPMASLKELTELISKSTDITRFETEKEHRLSALQMEESQVFPDITIAGGISGNEIDDYAYVV